MERLTERVNDRLIMMKRDSGDNVPYYYWDEGNFKVAEKLATYEDLEERLHKIFGEESTFSLADVIDTLEMELSEPDKKHPVNARILTYEEANKWQEYKDLEEHGLLVRLPCKVGDTVYTLSYKYECKNDYDCKVPRQWKCEENIPCEYEKKIHYVKESKFCLNMLDFLGKTVFLTREEAEKKLEEMKK